jgi:hypothetical protein
MSSPTTPASIGPGEFFPVVGVGPHDSLGQKVINTILNYY